MVHLKLICNMVCYLYHLSMEMGHRFFRFLQVTATACLCVGCATLPSPAVPPLRLPIDFQSPGKQATVKFSVLSRHIFFMTVYFTPKKANANPADFFRVLGGQTNIQCGIETPIRVQLVKYTTSGERKYIDEEYLPRTTGSTVSSLFRTIGATVLDPGEFQLTFIPGVTSDEVNDFITEVHVDSGGWKIIPQADAVEGQPPKNLEKSIQCQ